jgi:CBS domain-containing protein
MMELTNLIIPTGTARPGMSVLEVFRECVRADVPGIPFQEMDGSITGKASIRHVLKETFIPDFMVKHAHLLGDKIHHLDIKESQLSDVLPLEIDPFILTEIAVVNSSTPIAKALATMEDLDTTYLFVIDDGVYKGIVSIMAIARTMLTNA